MSGPEEPKAPAGRERILRLALILPAFLAFLAIASKPVLTDTPIGANSLALLLGALVYLGGCVWLAKRRALLAKLALSAWAVVLSGAIAAAVFLQIKHRKEARSVDAFERKWTESFQGEPWAREYTGEFRASTQMEWRPYVLWRRRPFVGRLINVDGAGLRRTWDPPHLGEGARSVFALGGSTLWGNGARDEHTIPSELSRLLNDAGRPARVTNFGELGFVSSQNLITLLLELRSGHVPDVVVCYDGVNDVIAALQNKRAGVPQLSSRLGGAMNRLFGDYYRSVTGLSPTPTHPDPRVSDDELVEQTVSSYLGNLRVFGRLAEAYRFKVLFVWQPVAFVGKGLTPVEAQRVEARRSATGRFFEKVYARMESAPTPPGFRNLSQVFDGNDHSLYIDFCHVTEEGNRLVAERISEELLPLLAP